MAGKVPYWVHKQEQAISEMSHWSYERQLQDRIRQLEDENSDLKKKIEKTENAILIALDLLTRKH